MTIDEKFDQKLNTELAKRLKRSPKAGELVNADNDSDLINEILWQLLKDMDERVTNLETCR